MENYIIGVASSITGTVIFIIINRLRKKTIHYKRKENSIFTKRYTIIVAIIFGILGWFANEKFRFYGNNYKPSRPSLDFNQRRGFQ